VPVALVPPQVRLSWVPLASIGHGAARRQGWGPRL